MVCCNWSVAVDGYSLELCSVTLSAYAAEINIIYNQDESPKLLHFENRASNYCYISKSIRDIQRVTIRIRIDSGMSREIYK